VRRRARRRGRGAAKPLEWGLIRRLFTYARPVRGKLTALIMLTVIRAAQLPALGWVVGADHQGADHRAQISRALRSAWRATRLLALTTDGIFHFRQRFALEIGETVVNGLRRTSLPVQRQPMSFFHRVKIGRIISRVTSDVEAVRVGIQDVLFVSAIQFGSDVLHRGRACCGSRLGAVPRGAGDGARCCGRSTGISACASATTRAPRRRASAA
jgi:ABC-type multidrug transport system fused ATPase/permease subunit